MKAVGHFGKVVLITTATCAKHDMYSE